MARDLIGSGVELRVETVGFLADDAARAQLRCIAEATGGTYTDASNATELADSLVEISSRAARSTQLSGVPVEGAVVPDEAPLIEPGSYTDTSVPGENLHYAFELGVGDRAHVELTIQEMADDNGGADAFGVGFLNPEYSSIYLPRDFTIFAGRDPETLVIDYELSSDYPGQLPEGDYYYVVVDRSAGDGPELAFEFTLEVERAAPSPSPSPSASPSPSVTPSPSPAASATASPPPVPVDPGTPGGRSGAVTAGVAGLLGALLGGGLVFAALRGRRAAPPGGR